MAFQEHSLHHNDFHIPRAFCCLLQLMSLAVSFQPCEPGRALGSTGCLRVQAASPSPRCSTQCLRRTRPGRHQGGPRAQRPLSRRRKGECADQEPLPVSGSAPSAQLQHRRHRTLQPSPPHPCSGEAASGGPGAAAGTFPAGIPTCPLAPVRKGSTFSPDLKA